MADDARWQPHVPASPCKPRPRECLWTMTKNGKRIDAELLFHGEYGVEIQFLYGGGVAYAGVGRFVPRRFRKPPRDGPNWSTKVGYSRLASHATIPWHDAESMSGRKPDRRRSRHDAGRPGDPRRAARH